MSLHQIMYISSVTGTVTPQECAAIARASAVSNRRDNVTGLLLFNSRRFLQVLEGPKEAVERIFARIHATAAIAAWSNCAKERSRPANLANGPWPMTIRSARPTPSRI